MGQIEAPEFCVATIDGLDVEQACAIEVRRAVFKAMRRCFARHGFTTLVARGVRLGAMEGLENAVIIGVLPGRRAEVIGEVCRSMQERVNSGQLKTPMERKNADR